MRPRYNNRSNQFPSRSLLPEPVIPSHHDNGLEPKISIQNTGIQKVRENPGRALTSRCHSHQIKGTQRRIARKRIMKPYAVKKTKIDEARSEERRVGKE